MKYGTAIVLQLLWLCNAYAGPGLELVGKDHIFVIADQLWPIKEEADTSIDVVSLWALNVIIKDRVYEQSCFMLRENAVAVSVYCKAKKNFSLSGVHWINVPKKVQGYLIDGQMRCVTGCNKAVPKFLTWRPD